MTGRARHSRRRLLDGLAGALAFGALAGCTDGSDATDGAEATGDDAGAADESDSADDDGSGSTEDDGGSDSPTADESSTTDGSDADLDLREANVVDVEFEREDGAYAFHVALHHDDEGEDGYANWWQVERLDGTQLGRRDLAHAHAQQPFTRSATIEIPDDVTCVVVRGHDQTHEYGGRVVLVDLESGATRPVDQGAEPTSVDEGDCP